MKKVKVSIGFHGSVDITRPVSVSGIIVNASKILSQKGYIFKIFCGSVGRESQKDNNLKNISLEPYFNRFFRWNTRFVEWGKMLWISYKLANSYADIIHIHQQPVIVIGYYLFKKSYSPVIYQIHCHPNAWKKVSRLERAFRRSDLVIAVSGFIEASLIKKFPFLKGKTKILYNGVDTKIFKPMERNNILKPRKKVFTVFFAGNIWLEKGFDILLKTAQELRKENIKFLIAGTFSPEKNPLHRQFKKNTPESVEYLGCIKHDNLPKYYANADVTITPSRWEEPFGMVIIESLACGTPVIGSRIGAIPELIDNEENGFLVTPGSVNELKDTILWCKKHPDMLKEMGIRARQKALGFDWKIISEQLKEIYEGLLIKKN